MKKVLVIGAAKSGVAACRLLKKMGYDVTVTDAKEIEEKKELENMGIQVYEKGHPDILKDISWEFIVKNPGIPYHVPFVAYFKERNVRILNEIEVSTWVAKNLRFGAVTGTNGKTTTTTLLGALLKRKDANAFCAGNIGVALSEIVEKNPSLSTDVALEIAGFQLMGCETFHPLVSVCMNLTPDHVDYFKSVDAYYKSKMLIYKNQTKEDTFLRNIDDENVLKYAQDIPCKVIDFSVYKDADLCVKEDRVMLYDQCLFELKDFHLPGRHNVQNAMVAACMAYLMGVSLNDIQEGIREFKGVEHRIEYAGEVNGVRFYNDSKGTNCDATKIALQAFDKPVLLLAGGYDKKTGFEELRPFMKNVKQMFVFGETKHQLEALKQGCVVCETMKEAFERAYALAEDGDIVLLSPACASWDQFDNFEQRGEIFKQYVENLKS